VVALELLHCVFRQVAIIVFFTQVIALEAEKGMELAYIGAPIPETQNAGS